MENVVLIVHLILSLGLIGVVLLQRSEGGGLGIGGGGGGTSAGRPPATGLGKVTWGLAIAFICTSITLTILAAQESAGRSVTDTSVIEPGSDTPVLPDLGGGDIDLPISPEDAGPVIPEAD